MTSPDPTGPPTAADPAPGGGLSGAGRSPLLVAAICLIGALAGSLTIPGLFERASPSVQDLDLSWQLGLGAALAQHLRFGVQYLFTYGPLGFLRLSMDYPDPTLRYLTAAVTVFVCLAYPVCLLLFANLVRRHRRVGRTDGALILASTLAVALCTGLATDLRPIVELLSLVALTACMLRLGSRLTPALAVGAGALLALGALIQVDLLYVAIGELVILTAVARFLPRRTLRIPALGWLGLVIAYPLLWVASGQRLTDFPRFWIGSWQISAGYSSAMSQATNWLPLAGIAVVALAGLIFPIATRRWHGRELSVQEVVILMSLPWLFISWKDGLVSISGLDNSRALALIGALLGVCWLVALVSWPLRSLRILGPLAASALCGVLMVGILASFVGEPWILVKLGLTHPARAATPISESGPNYLPRSLIDRLRGHTVNVLPWDDSLAIDEQLRWDPLPVAQTYSAYTAYLDRLDAQQLASPAGASRLVVSLIDIDGRYLLWDPPAVWNTVISRYSCLATSGISAVLARRAPRLGATRTVGQTTTRFGTWVKVPSSGLAYEFASVDISSSLEGEALNLLLRQVAVQATMRLSDGSVVGPVRLVAATAGDDLYLSHYVTTARQLCGLLSAAGGTTPTIVAIKFTSPHVSQWSDSIEIRFLGASMRG